MFRINEHMKRYQCLYNKELKAHKYKLYYSFSKSNREVILEEYYKDVDEKITMGDRFTMCFNKFSTVGKIDFIKIISPPPNYSKQIIII